MASHRRRCGDRLGRLRIAGRDRIRWHLAKHHRTSRHHGSGSEIPTDAQTCSTRRTVAGEALAYQPDAVLFDARSRPEFGPIGELFRRGAIATEIANQRTRIVGTFEMGASFSADGTIFTTDEGFARIFYASAASCWQPAVKGLTLMVNSVFNSFRYEDIWLDG